MALPIPSSLSPSKVATFRDCALAFRLSAIDKIPEPPSIPAIKGTTVHRALELLLAEPATARTDEAARSHLNTALEEFEASEEFRTLDMTSNELAAFQADAATMVARYFGIEDPRSIEPIGLELMIETDLDGVLLRGIIDRLESDQHGGLIVTDYKTGRTPSLMAEQQKLGGVHFYSLLCERELGKRPTEVRLLYLGNQPEVIVARPSEQSTRGLERKLKAIWVAIQRACEREDFRPKPGTLCNWCSFKAYCPAFGGAPPPMPIETPAVAPSKSRLTSVAADAFPPVAFDDPEGTPSP
jgi:putative RecB family exonuclease